MRDLVLNLENNICIIPVDADSTNSLPFHLILNLFMASFFPQTPFQKTHLLHHFALLLTLFFFLISCLITDLILYPWCTDIANDRVWYYISCLVFCNWSFWLRMLLLDLSDENSHCLISQRQIQIQVS